LALRVYSDLNNDMLPGRDQWMDAVQSHLKEQRVLKDPEVEEKGQYGYAFHSRLSERKRSTFAKPESTPMLFDSINLGRNASDPFTSLPKPGRHNGANCVSYLDTHVKRLYDKEN